MASLEEQIEQYDVVGSPEDNDLHAIARLAAHICGTSSAMVNLLDARTQHTVAAEGFPLGATPRVTSMCDTALGLADSVHVPDAREDPRFAGSPFVTGELGSIRLYAASLLRTSEGTTIGTLCVGDEEPGRLETSQLAALDDLGRQVVQVLEMRARAHELARTNAELARSNADLAAFTGRIAHDLRNPIAATRGFLTLATGAFGNELTGRARECVEHAAGANARMAELVDGLLAYSAVDAKARIRPVDLADLVGAIAVDLRELLGRTGGRISIGELPTVETDPSLLRQLLQNLVSNGLKYSRTGVQPLVELNGEMGVAAWSVSVVDNGRGIAMQDRASVFDLFVRLPGGRDVAGNGIGLATCARIAEALGGRIAISDTPGGGTTFTFTVASARAA